MKPHTLPSPKDTATHSYLINHKTYSRWSYATTLFRALFLCYRFIPLVNVSLWEKMWHKLAHCPASSRNIMTSPPVDRWVYIQPVMGLSICCLGSTLHNQYQTRAQFCSGSVHQSLSSHSYWAKNRLMWTKPGSGFKALTGCYEPVVLPG